MKNLLFLFLILILFIQPVSAQEYNTLSVTNSLVRLLKYDDKAKLPRYGDKMIDVGNGYKILLHKDSPNTIEIFKFTNNNLLWVKSFNLYRSHFKTAFIDNNGNIVVELENYSKEEVLKKFNKGRVFDALVYETSEKSGLFLCKNVYLNKTNFIVDKNGIIVSGLKSILFEAKSEDIAGLAICDSFNYNGKHYYILADQVFFMSIISRIHFYLLEFESENDKMVFKNIKYLFSQNNIKNISIDSSSKAVKIALDSKKMELKGETLYFVNLESIFSHLFGSIRHVCRNHAIENNYKKYSNNLIDNELKEFNYTKEIGSLKKLQKDKNNTILLVKRNSIVRINGKKIFIKNLDSRLLRDIDNISYNNDIYKIKLKETPEYEQNLYLNDEINIKEDGTIINPLKIIKINNCSRNSIKKFKKYGHDFVKIDEILYLLDDNQLYSTDFSFKEGEHDIQIIDNENYYLKYLKTERIIKKYNYYNNGYNPEKERECDFKFSNGFKFWLKGDNLLLRTPDSDKTYHLGRLFQYSVKLPDDFKILDIKIFKNESIVEINTSLGKVIFIPEEEKIISPEIVVKKKFVKIDKPITVIEKFWENSDLNTDKDVYYIQSSEIN